ncbi:putative lipid II flippase FtsW [Patescibacteria group bacterium]
MIKTRKSKQNKWWRLARAGSTNTHKPDYSLLIVIFLLVIFGLVAVASASSVMSYDLTSRLIAEGLMDGDPTNYYFLKSQLINGVLIGVILFALVTRINYRFWKKIAPWMLVITLVLLIAVFIPGIGFSSGGAARWISVGPLFFQPAELAKLTFVLYLAAWLDSRGQEVKGFSTGFIPFIASVIVVAALILLQPDLGTLLVILMAAITMYFVAGAKYSHLAIIGTGGIGFLFLAIKLAPFRLARFAVFLNPELDPQGIGFQINQALLAIGSGGLLGMGLGHSRQKFNFLPEVAGDSIFAVIAEELGFIRSILLILLFIFLAYKGYKIAKSAPDNFGRFVAVGITTWLIAQAFINIAGITSLMPLTGIPLPFVSYGGSALVIALVSAAILFNISRYTVQAPVRNKASKMEKMWGNVRSSIPRKRNVKIETHSIDDE